MKRALLTILLVVSLVTPSFARGPAMGMGFHGGSMGHWGGGSVGHWGGGSVSAAHWGGGGWGGYHGGWVGYRGYYPYRGYYGGYYPYYPYSNAAYWAAFGVGAVATLAGAFAPYAYPYAYGYPYASPYPYAYPSPYPAYPPVYAYPNAAYGAPPPPPSNVVYQTYNYGGTRPVAMSGTR